MPEPSKIPAAWAWDGDINTIPATDPGNGLASWELGYPIETQTPIAAGGVPPRRQDMNGVLNWLSLYSLWDQKGGLWAYDATEDYEQGNIVIQSNVIYYCKSANGPSGTVKSPSSDTAGTYWKKLVNADGTLNVPVVGNATTSARGIVELATSAETKALTDAQRAVTPSSLNGLLSLSPAALVVPKSDSSGKLTGWLDALKDNDGRVNISIKGSAPTLQTARTVRVALGSTSAASFDGSTNITPGVSGTLGVGNGGTGQTNLDLVTVGKAKALNTARSVRTNLGSTSAVNFDGTANITPGVTGTLPVANGGTGQTNLDAVTVGKAKALNTARAIRTNLASSSAASFNGTADITPGVSGVLPVVNGGTGKNDLDAVTVGTAKHLTSAGVIEVLKAAYPVGSIYISYNATNPATLFGFGTWQKIEGRFLLGSATGYSLNSTGGASTVTLTTQQIPSHNHSATTASAGGHTHTVTVNSAGSHTHTRGTMNITGSLMGETVPSDYPYSGAFYETTPNNNRGIGSSDGNNGKTMFDASRAWTGATSSEGYHTHTASTATAGAHTHSMTVGNTGGGKAHENMPPYIVVTIWRRTA